MITATRGLGLQDMVEVLRDQRARRLDLVVPGSKLAFKDGALLLSGFDQVLEDDGITDPNGTYRMTDVFDGDLNSRLGIPPALTRQLRHGRTGPTLPSRLDILDDLLNSYFQGRKGKTRWNAETQQHDEILAAIPADKRKFLLRLFVSEDGQENIARALLSDRFAVMDNLDALMAMLKGIEQAGIDPTTLRISGDLSETRMYIKVHAPEISVLSPKFMDGYRNPFNDAGFQSQREAVQHRMALGRAYNEGGRAGLLAAGHEAAPGHMGVIPGQEPILHSGFVLSNSEVGQGMYTIAHQIVVLACMNGMTRKQDAMERKHLGASLEEGAIKWSADTQQKNIDLISGMARDAVATFLNQDYLETAVKDLERKSDASLGETPAKAEEIVRSVAKKVQFSDSAIDGILEHFREGGQRTSGGLAQAITSYSQTVDNANEAYDLDGKAIQAMELAYASA